MKVSASRITTIGSDPVDNVCIAEITTAWRYSWRGSGDIMSNCGFKEPVRNGLPTTSVPAGLRNGAVDKELFDWTVSYPNTPSKPLVDRVLAPIKHCEHTHGYITNQGLYCCFPKCKGLSARELRREIRRIYRWASQLTFLRWILPEITIEALCDRPIIRPVEVIVSREGGVENRKLRLILIAWDFDPVCSKGCQSIYSFGFCADCRVQLFRCRNGVAPTYCEGIVHDIFRAKIVIRI